MENSWQQQLEADQIVRAGGRVCVGSHGAMQGISAHWDMWAMQSGGMTNFEVLRAATLHGAEAIGYAQNLGSIEVGKLADLIERDTLNQVWPKQKKPPQLWWWGEQQ